MLTIVDEELSSEQGVLFLYGKAVILVSKQFEWQHPDEMWIRKKFADVWYNVELGLAMFKDV